MRYYKFPKWLKRFYPNAIWDFSFQDSPDSNTNQPTIYLTFDDGPNENTTQSILDILDNYQAKATFFCLGQNVERLPRLYQKILDNKHNVGNHSYSHLNGIYTNTETYINDIVKAKSLIASDLFRPPYGKLKPKQFKQLEKLHLKTVFWSHISYDFDTNLSSEKRVAKALQCVKGGSIIVFHDSEKAFPHLKKELPLLLDKWTAAGYQFSALKNDIATVRYNNI